MEEYKTEPYGVIYVIVDRQEPERVRYVGQTTRGIPYRRQGHWTDAAKGNLPVNRFLEKRRHRKSEVEFQEIDTAETREELDDKEVFWISEFRSIGQADLNLTDGGGGAKGRRMSDAEKEAKRKSMIGRFRGDKYLGEVKLTWDIVRQIREQSTQRWESQQDIAERYGVTQSVIYKVLQNRAWIDDEYTPDFDKIKTRPPETHANNRQIPESVVKEIRELRMREWVPEKEIARRYGLTRSNVNNILRNFRWPDPEYDPSKMVKAGGNGTGSKLVESDVVEIRRRAKAGEFQREIAKDFGIEQTQVSRIVRGVQWGHVKEGLE